MISYRALLHLAAVAAFPVIRCRCGKRLRVKMPSGGAVRRGRVVTVYHNGSSFRDSVPVWKETVGERPSGGAVTRVNMVTV